MGIDISSGLEQKKLSPNKTLTILLISGLFLSLAFSAILVVLLIQKETFVEQSRTNTVAVQDEFLSVLNSGDIEGLENYIENNQLEALNFNSGKYSPISLLDILAFNPLRFSAVDEETKGYFSEKYLNAPLYDTLLVSEDGRIFILLRSINGSLATVYLFIDTDDVGTDVSDSNSAGEALENPEELERSIELKSSVDFFSVEKDQQGTIGFYYLSKNLVSASCIFEFKNSSTVLRTEEFTVNDDGGQITYLLAGPGEYGGDLTCSYADQVYTDTVTIEGKEVPGSICDSKDFNLTGDYLTLGEVKSKIVGIWRGCASNPWTKPYRIELSLNANGSYTSRNIEVVENPDTVRRNSGLYYGLDQNSSYKTYELKNQISNGDVEGDINIYFGGSSVNLDLIRSVRISDDGNTLYFEIIHSGKYGPIKFILERV